MLAAPNHKIIAQFDPRLMEDPFAHAYNRSIAGGIAVVSNLYTPPIARGPFKADDFEVTSEARPGRLLFWIRYDCDRNCRDIDAMLQPLADSLRGALFVEAARARSINVALRVRFANTGDRYYTIN